jgi:hypothetical protein
MKSPFDEANSSSAGQEIAPAFVEPEGLLPCPESIPVHPMVACTPDEGLYT